MSLDDFSFQRESATMLEDGSSSGPPSYQPKQQPLSASLNHDHRNSTTNDIYAREGEMGDDEEGTGSAEGASGRLVLERARLRRKTSHHVPAPPAAHHHESTTSDGGTSASSSRGPPPRPPPIRRRTSHPPATLKSLANGPLPHLNLPSGPTSDEFDDLFQRRGSFGGGPSRQGSPFDPSSRGKSLSAQGTSSGTDNGFATRPGLRTHSFGSGGGSSRSSNRRTSKDDLSFLTAGPRVLPRSFFGGQDIQPLSAPPERSGSGSGSGSARRAAAEKVNGGSSSSAGSGGDGSSSGAQPERHHHHHPERKKHVNLEYDTTPIENLPDLSVEEEDDGGGETPRAETLKNRRTSYPNKNVQTELDASMRDLVSVDVFAKLLKDPVGRDRFREWLVKAASTPSSLDSLDFYNDSQAYRKFLEEFRHVGLSLHATFLSENARRPVNHLTGSDEAESSSAALQRQRSHIETSPFEAAAQKALMDLYENEFGKFLRSKVVEQAKVRLGLFANPADRGDLGDVFCLTNPRLPDHPIVMCSDGFVRLTGYPRNQIVGRNCRFLQGPSTDPKTVLALRTALEAGKPSCQILLNYKRNGEPFLNLLSIIPLRSRTGHVEYFLAGQVNVSAALASAKTLAFLIGADQTSLQNALSIERSHQFQESDLRLSSEVVESVESHIGHKSVFAKTRSAAFGSAPSWASSSRGYGGGRASTADSPGGGSGSGRDSRAQSGFFSSGGSGNENGSGRESATQGTNEVLNRLKTTGMGGFAIGENGGVESSSGGEGVTPRAERPESEESGAAQAGNNGSGIYTSLLVIRASPKLEILYVTPPLLELLGYPFATSRQAYNSPLLHSDFTDLLVLPTRHATRSLHALVRSVVLEQEISQSVKAGLAHLENGRRRPGFRTEEGVRFSMGLMHLIPLRDAEGVVDCYVCVFGA